MDKLLLSFWVVVKGYLLSLQYFNMKSSSMKLFPFLQGFLCDSSSFWVKSSYRTTVEMVLKLYGSHESGQMHCWRTIEIYFWMTHDLSVTFLRIILILWDEMCSLHTELCTLHLRLLASEPDIALLRDFL